MSQDLEYLFYKEYKLDGYPIREIAKKYGYSYKYVLDRIHIYCNKNDIEFIPNKNRKRVDVKSLYQDYMYNKELSTKDLEEKYNYRFQSLLNRIDEYCIKNNLERVTRNNWSTKKLEFDNELLYKEYSVDKMTISYLCEKYNCDRLTIYKRLHNYCEENNIKFEAHKNRMYIDMKEVYKDYINGMTATALEEKYGHHYSIILERIYEYAKDNNLIIPSRSGRKRNDIDINEVFYLYTNGMNSEEFIKKYGCSYRTIIRKLKEFCEIEDINFKILIDFHKSIDINNTNIKYFDDEIIKENNKNVVLLLKSKKNN